MNVTMRLTISLLIAILGATLAVAGCAEADTPSSGDSGIAGQTVVDGGCPLVRQSSPCPDRALPARLTVIDGDGRTVATVETGSDGAFNIPLPPGDYVLRPRNQTGSMHPAAADVAVHVAPGAVTTLTVSFDSGIR